MHIKNTFKKLATAAICLALSLPVIGTITEIGPPVVYADEAESNITDSDEVQTVVITEPTATQRAVSKIKNLFSGTNLASDGSTNSVDKFEVKLENASSFDYKNGKYSITPEEDRKDYLQPTYSINFSLSGSEPWGVGSIELRIPAKLFYDRDGNYSPADDNKQNYTTTSFSLPESPATSNKTSFNYRYDSNAEEYVISNYESIPAATQVTFSLPYLSNIYASTVKSGSKSDDFSAKLTANSIQKSASAPGIYTYTDTKYVYCSLFLESKSLSFPSGWDSAYNTVSGKYLYVVYGMYAATTHSSTQAYKETLSIAPSNGGVVLGYKSTPYNTKTFGPSTSPIQVEQKSGVSYCRANNMYALVAYPVSNYTDGHSYTITATMTASLVGYDTSKDTISNPHSLQYSYIAFSAPPGNNKLEKEAESDSVDEHTVYVKDASGNYNHVEYGMLPALKAGLNATQSWSSFWVIADGQNYKSTFKGGDASDSNNYGYYASTYSLVDDAVFFNDDYSRKLTSNDYEISSVTCSLGDSAYQGTVIYEYTNSDGSWTATQMSESKWPQIYLYANVDDGEWEKIGIFRRTHQNGQIYNRFYDINNPKEILSLNGKGYTGVKIETESSAYRVRLAVNVRLTIKPSPYILNKISTTNDINTITNISTFCVRDHNGNIIAIQGSYAGRGAEAMKKRDQETYGTSMYHDYDKIALGDVHETVTIKKEHASAVYDNESSVIKIPYTIKLLARQENASGLTAIQLGIKEQNSGTFYDLLPAGAFVDASSITVSGASDDETKTINADFTTSTIDNYNGTGRTLLVINTTAKDNFILTTNSYSLSGFTVNYTLSYPYEAVTDFGTKLHNDVIYMTGNSVWDAKNVSTATNLSFDLSDVLSSKVSEKLFISTSCDATVLIGSDAELSLSKAVKDSDNTIYSSGKDSDVIVSDGESYSYRLRFGSADGTTTSNIILFDSIENFTTPSGNSSGWRGILQNIDVSQPKAKGINPVIYYSTIANLDVSTNTDITKKSIWSTTVPSDLSTITAVAIDLRKTTSGNAYTLPEKETIRVTINMKAPTGDTYKVAQRKKAVAYNNVYLLDNIKSSTGTLNNHLVHYDWTEVRLEEPDILPVSVSLSGKKILTDASKSGRKLQADEFSFILKDSSGKILQTKTNADDGTVTFDEIEYVEEGTYTYTIKEALPAGGTYSEDKTKYIKDQISYDLNLITVSIVVTVNDNNELVATKQ